LGLYFQNTLGITTLERTPTGKPKMDKEALQGLQHHENLTVQELAKASLKVRENLKMSSTYFDAFIREARDGEIIRPEIRTNGARTGRSSISKPPLQQLATGSDLIRSSLVPRVEENRIITCDYSQIEFRIFASLSDDSNLLEAFETADATNGDIFVELGKKIYHDENFSREDRRRSTVKTLVYAILFGAGLEKQAASAGLELSEMQQHSKAFYASFPRVRRFISSVTSSGEYREEHTGRGFIVNRYGRKLYSDEKKSYALTNYLIQSSAAIVLKQALVRLDQSSYGEYMVIPVHDEIVLDLPAELVEQALIEVPEIMRDDSYKVPLLASSEGPFTNWGEKYKRL
jgi:DNA polymerase-1